MTTIHGAFHHKSVGDEMINKSLNEIFLSNTLLSMASIKDEKESWIHTAYYAYSDKLRLYYLSAPSAQHSKNVESTPSIAVSIFDTHQAPESKKRGLQVFGQCRQAVGQEVAEGLTFYTERFPWIMKYITEPEDFDKGVLESKLYIIVPHTIKIFDEAMFGEEEWVVVNVPQ